MIKVLIKSSSRYPIDRKKVKEVVKKVLGSRFTTGDMEISILFVGDRKMTQLNKKWLKREGTTNVISFPLNQNFPDQVLRLGDIVISYPQARKQASQHNVTVDEEIGRLVEHGVLSLLGLHHE